MNYIFVNGYGCTGSSAVVDYLREFDCVKVPIVEKEFRLITDPYGIIDLDRALNNSIDPLNEDIAIKKFIWMTNKYIEKPGKLTDVRCGYINEFGENIRIQTKQYIDTLIGRSYEGYWWYMDMEKTARAVFFKKLLNKLKIKDFESYEKINLCLLSEREFIEATRKYLYSLFIPFVDDEEKEYLVLDNSLPATHPSYADRYFGDYRMINVERDPRDIYVNLCKKKLLIGYYSSKTHDPSLFVEWYKKMRVNQEKSEKVMTVWFEDFVTNYDSECKKICSFLSLSDENNTNKRTLFDPNRSINDVGLWKKYPYKDEIEFIESHLSGNLYDDHKS